MSRRLLEDVERIECIGKGNFALVYRCRHRYEKHTPHFAVKVLDLDTPVAIEDIAREVLVMRMSKHENLVRLHSATLRGKRLWMAMELASAGSVADIVKAQGPLSEAVAAIILRGMLQGLAYMHAFGWIHSDIKSNNLLLTHDGVVKLCDFGVAIVGQVGAASTPETDAPAQTQSSAPTTSAPSCYEDWLPPAARPRPADGNNHAKQFAGTPLYMAPEIIRRKGVSSASDIWSAGIVAIELVSGSPPYSDQHPLKAMQLLAANDPPTLQVKHTRPYADCCCKMLTKDPQQRATAEHMLKVKPIKGAKNTKKLCQLLKTYTFDSKHADEGDSSDDDDDDAEHRRQFYDDPLAWEF
ncbi:STE/STE20/YSK protein kinase [Salpingoeca rosetta]|uniref:non-specific serine/threonine protein kinase n=1 Tax=Salpingoeca rosetta (strain ATCC 50818 / BSB-021) TaxID=946362 RepID=F2UNL6_SALR5|nr:STE/STE20/YSK protein kinase [Salpingoeca rosetta]EGD79221.1 STE/STE20/YSK protein kinase [Salpingoeca rosetta]|eukprot:XP_004989306.1 STE/STE20/YSK protein kinase [Salpingoeca rosetta]